MVQVKKCAECGNQTLSNTIFVESNHINAHEHAFCSSQCAAKYIQKKRYKDYEITATDTQIQEIEKILQNY